MTLQQQEGPAVHLHIFHRLFPIEKKKASHRPESLESLDALQIL